MIHIHRLFLHAPLALGLCVFLSAPAHAQSQDPAQASNLERAEPAPGQTQSAPIATAFNPQIKPAYWASNIGFEGDSHNTGYSFAGPQYVHPFAPKAAVVAGANVNYLWYGYQNGVGGRNSVHSPGANAAAGIRVGDSNWAQFTAGPGVKNRRLKVEDGTNTVMSTTSDLVWGMNYDASAYVNPSKRNNVFAMYHYGAEDKYTWTRLAFKQQVSNYGWQGRFTHYLGVQVVGQGNKDIHSTQVGPTLEFLHVPSSTSFSLGTGWKHSTFPIGPDESGPYFAIGVWRRLN